MIFASDIEIVFLKSYICTKSLLYNYVTIQRNSRRT